jgi:hypothetical protein
MDVNVLDATIVKGSHGRMPMPGCESTQGPVFVCSERTLQTDRLAMTDVKDTLLSLQFG